MLDMPTELRSKWLRYLAADRQEEVARMELHTAIRKASESGMSVRAIASEIGLSYQRVAQILKREKE